MLDSAPQGPWKEGRAGGASLCYLPLPPGGLELVAKHHAAVGIRATLACDAIRDEDLRPLVGRNWDLAVLAPLADETLPPSLAALDGRASRGWVWTEAAHVAPEGLPLYQLSTLRGSVEQPGPSLASPLPSLVAEETPEAMMNAIEEVVGQGRWGVWRLDAATLERWTPAGHARLLRWLGDHHARIWCAPIRDIGTWQRPSAQ